MQGEVPVAEGLTFLDFLRGDLLERLIRVLVGHKGNLIVWGAVC